jgi:hypothetical protein
MTKGQNAHETSEVCSWQMLVLKSQHRAQNPSAQASNTDSNQPRTDSKTLQATQKKSKFKSETRQNKMLKEPMANHRFQEKCSPDTDIR